MATEAPGPAKPPRHLGAAPPPAGTVTSPQVLPASSCRGGVISAALGGRGGSRACAQRRLRDTRSRAYVRARRCREAGGCVRAVAGSPLGLLRTGSRALAAAAIMSAAIEQEFQEIDATNDWQARYLVSRAAWSALAGEPQGGRNGGGRKTRGPAAPVPGVRLRRRLSSGESGSRWANTTLALRCEQRSRGQALRMRTRGGLEMGAVARRRGARRVRGLGGGSGSALPPGLNGAGTAPSRGHSEPEEPPRDSRGLRAVWEAVPDNTDSGEAWLLPPPPPPQLSAASCGSLGTRPPSSAPIPAALASSASAAGALREWQ